MHIGIVSTQARMIVPTIPHRTADTPRVEPTPMMDVEITCVVLIGIPKCEAARMIVEPADSAAKP